jgi:hypothetical protein
LLIFADFVAHRLECLNGKRESCGVAERLLGLNLDLLRREREPELFKVILPPEVRESG